MQVPPFKQYTPLWLQSKSLLTVVVPSIDVDDDVVGTVVNGSWVSKVVNVVGSFVKNVESTEV